MALTKQASQMKENTSILKSYWACYYAQLGIH